jgi:hypothetical protein
MGDTREEIARSAGCNEVLDGRQPKKVIVVPDVSSTSS